MISDLKNASPHDGVGHDKCTHSDLGEHELHRASAAVLDGPDLVVPLGAGGRPLGPHGGPHGVGPLSAHPRGLCPLQPGASGKWGGHWRAWMKNIGCTLNYLWL